MEGLLMNKYNSEGYPDPTAYEALTNIAKAEKRGGQAAPAIRKKVYICSPYRGNNETEVTENISRAIKYCKLAVKGGVLPVAPHIYLTRFLNDNESADRKLGLTLGLGMLRDCSEVWVFGERISEGMKTEIAEAKRLGINIKYIES